MDCLFCKIVSKEMNATIVFENEHLLAFRDIAPQAPCHILIIPKRHISSLNHLTDDDQTIMGQLPLAAAQIAKSEGIADDGYRLALNCNDHGGQTVYHIHMHLLGGRQMHWPPG